MTKDDVLRLCLQRIEDSLESPGPHEPEWSKDDRALASVIRDALNASEPKPCRHDNAHVTETGSIVRSNRDVLGVDAQAPNEQRLSDVCLLDQLQEYVRQFRGGPNGHCNTLELELISRAADEVKRLLIALGSVATERDAARGAHEPSAQCGCEFDNEGDIEQMCLKHWQFAHHSLVEGTAPPAFARKAQERGAQPYAMKASEADSLHRALFKSATRVAPAYRADTCTGCAGEGSIPDRESTSGRSVCQRCHGSGTELVEQSPPLANPEHGK